MKAFDGEWCFLHAADLHLDAAFQGVRAAPDMPATIRTRLREATFRAYDNLIRTALRENVRVALFAGDLFNADEGSIRARLAFHDGLSRLTAAGVAVFTVRGNHDPWTGASEMALPEGAHEFGPEPSSCTHVFSDGLTVAVAGASHASHAELRNLTALLPPPEKDGAFRIGLVHCHVATAGLCERHARYAACSLEDFERGDRDYWALGHIHQHWRGGGRAPVVYSGALQGLHVHENGPHGAVLVTVRGGAVAEVEPRALDVLRWETVSVALGEAETLDRLEAAMRERIFAAAAEWDGRDGVVRVRLEGRGPLYHTLSAAQAREDLLARLRGAMPVEGGFIWIESLAFRGRPELDFDALRADERHLAGEVLRQAAALAEDPVGVRMLVDRALPGGGAQATRLRELLSEMSDDECAAVLDQARALLVDRLCGED